MEPETTIRLAQDFDNIVAIKEAGNNPEQYKMLLENKPDDFLVISGDDDLVCDVVLQGGSGVISVIGQALPKLFSTMIHKGLEGDEKTSKALEKKAIPLIKLIFEENNPAGIKAVLQQLELCDDTVRLPLVKATDALKSKIKAELAKL
jgi:4-hydroxy-tetrahydrodipicolinate synthase